MDKVESQTETEVSLRDLRIDEGLWSSGSPPRRLEWQQAIEEIVDGGRFWLADVREGPLGPVRALLRQHPEGLVLELRGSDGQIRLEALLPHAELRPFMDEYMQTCLEMSKLGLGARSPRLEALDIAKRLTHDEAGEIIARLLAPLRPDHATARRLFTLIVTLYHDTTRIAAPAHVVR